MIKAFLIAALAVLLAWPSFAVIYINFGGSTTDPDPVLYRTIAIIGDTQSMTLAGRQGGPSAQRWLDFKEQIDWIIANKDVENIDFVLQVGDMSDTGTTLSTGIYGSLNTDVECTGEGAAIDGGDNYANAYSQTDGACQGRSSTESVCEAGAPIGCYADPGVLCLGCIRVKYTDEELDLFEAQWDRLEAAEIPAFNTAGNHDPKARAALSPEATPLGWNDRWGTSHWTDLAVASQSWARSFTYLGTRIDNDEGNSQAWLATLNSTPPLEVVIVSLPYESVNRGTSATAIAWAADQFNAYSANPGIVLTHDEGQVAPTLLDVSTSVAPSIFMSAAGHIGWPSTGNRKTIEINGTERILEIQTDYTNNNNPAPAGSAQLDENGVLQQDYITLVRWYPETEEIESLDWSAQGQAFINTDPSLGALSRVEKTSFDIMPPNIPAILAVDAPYDLRAYADEIDVVWSGLTPPAWPEPPTTTTTTVEADIADCGALETLVDGAAQHIQLTGSKFVACSPSISGTDIWLEMGNSAELSGLTIVSGADDIKVSGGNVLGNSTVGTSGTISDILIENVKFGTLVDAVDNNILIAGNIVRFAMIKSDVYCGRYCLNNTSNEQLDDIIYAGNDIRGMLEHYPTTPSLASMIQIDIGNAVYAENCILNPELENHRAFRFRDRAEDLLIVANHIITEGPSGAATYHETCAGGVSAATCGPHDNQLWTLNDFWMNGTTGVGQMEETSETYGIGDRAGKLVSFDNNTVHRPSSGSFNFFSPTNTPIYSNVNNNTLFDYSSRPACPYGADH